MVPCYIKLKPDIITPIGLAVNPAKVLLTKLKQLLQDIWSGDDTISTSWMDTVLFTGWYTAVANHPLDFASMAIPHTTYTSTFSNTAPCSAISLRLHQEWTLFSHAWWDTKKCAMTSTAALPAMPTN